MPGLALNLLGPLAVTVDDRPFDALHIRPTVALCVYLACCPQRHRREPLMALLWPDWPPAAAHKNLRQNLYTLRQVLPVVAARDGRGPVPLVLADHDTLQLNPDAAVDLDVDRFTALLRQDTLAATETAVASQMLLTKACRSYQLSSTTARFVNESCPSTTNVVRKSRKSG